MNIELKNAKKEYYSTRIADEGTNPKKAWKTINNVLGRKNKQTVVNELKLGDNSLTNPKDIAEVFNDYTVKNDRLKQPKIIGYLSWSRTTRLK